MLHNHSTTKLHPHTYILLFCVCSSLKLIAKLSRKYRGFLYLYPSPVINAFLLPVSSSREVGCVQCMTSKTRYYPESTVYFRAHSQCPTFCEIGQVHTSSPWDYSVIQDSCCPKNSLCFAYPSYFLLIYFVIIICLFFINLE
jgi:hypothetical protein